MDIARQTRVKYRSLYRRGAQLGTSGSWTKWLFERRHGLSSWSISIARNSVTNGRMTDTGEQTLKETNHVGTARKGADATGQPR